MYQTAVAMGEKKHHTMYSRRSFERSGAQWGGSDFWIAMRGTQAENAEMDRVQYRKVTAIFVVTDWQHIGILSDFAAIGSAPQYALNDNWAITFYWGDEPQSFEAELLLPSIRMSLSSFPFPHCHLTTDFFVCTATVVYESGNSEEAIHPSAVVRGACMPDWKFQRLRIHNWIASDADWKRLRQLYMQVKTAATDVGVQKSSRRSSGVELSREVDEVTEELGRLSVRLRQSVTTVLPVWFRLARHWVDEVAQLSQ